MVNNDYTSNKVDAIMSLLQSKYNGDLNYYDKAEKEISNKMKMRYRLKYLNNIAMSDENALKINDPIKHTYVNLKDKTAWIEEMTDSTLDAVLAYSYDYLSVKRILPYSLNTFLNNAKNKDKLKAKTKEEQDRAQDTFEWVQNRVLNTQFSLSSLSLNKKTGTLQYNTATRDVNYGMTLQFITVVIDPSKLINLSGTDISGKILDLSQNSHLLFNYFLMFGFSEFYARCTCPDYYSKYSRKRGVANYMCSHLLYSLAQLPYYAFYYLDNN